MQIKQATAGMCSSSRSSPLQQTHKASRPALLLPPTIPLLVRLIPASLHLEAVAHVHGPLVDGRPACGLARLAWT